MFILQNIDFQCLLRRDRDSNPRYSCPYTAFRVRPDRPLRHLSQCISDCKDNILIFITRFFRKNIFSYLYSERSFRLLKTFLHVIQNPVVCSDSVLGLFGLLFRPPKSRRPLSFSGFARCGGRSGGRFADRNLRFRSANPLRNLYRNVWIG